MEGEKPMPEPMRFWELMSAFRDCRDVLRDVLASEHWRDHYLALYETYEDLVSHQDRLVLDAPVPLELSRPLPRGLRCALLLTKCHRRST